MPAFHEAFQPHLRSCGSPLHQASGARSRGPQSWDVTSYLYTLHPVTRPPQSRMNPALDHRETDLYLQPFVKGGFIINQALNFASFFIQCRAVFLPSLIVALLNFLHPLSPSSSEKCASSPSFLFSSQLLTLPSPLQCTLSHVEIKVVSARSSHLGTTLFNPATLLVRELLSDGPNGHFRRAGEDLGKGEGEGEDAHLKHIPQISLEPPEDEGIKGHKEHDKPNHIPNQVHEFLNVPIHATHTLAESKASIHAEPK
ncbi:hypothetical protein K439DRAFT_1624934 [Ramaria rubella]|nr:hypothetical protein K439DRAFT_1624934 [Ramaria rubella]